MSLDKWNSVEDGTKEIFIVLLLWNILHIKHVVRVCGLATYYFYVGWRVMSVDC